MQTALEEKKKHCRGAATYSAQPTTTHTLGCPLLTAGHALAKCCQASCLSPAHQAAGDPTCRSVQTTGKGWHLATEWHSRCAAEQTECTDLLLSNSTSGHYFAADAQLPAGCSALCSAQPSLFLHTVVYSPKTSPLPQTEKPVHHQCFVPTTIQCTTPYYSSTVNRPACTNTRDAP